jgi:serine/threonine protein phosphatase PrpC
MRASVIAASGSNIAETPRAKSMTRSASLCLRVAALTHVGLRRRSNEDCIAIGSRILTEPMDEPWLSVQKLHPSCACLVADGMGGHPAGEVASRAAIESMLSGLAHVEPEAAGLDALLRETNRFLFTEMARCPHWYGMGTTLAGIVTGPERLIAFNVGDSRIYRIEQSVVKQLSVDDSESAGIGLFFSRLPARVLSQCLGGFPDTAELEPHLVELPLVEGSRYLICSDGLHDMLSDAEISGCLDPDPARTVAALFQAAMDEGGIDNISIVVAGIERDQAQEDDASAAH